MNDFAYIGRSVQRKEGRAKVTGAALFTDDLKIEGLLHGATVRSRVPRGRITGIHFEDNFPWEEFIIVTARDIPGKNAVAHLIKDQPCLADGVINHAEEAIVLLAHPDPLRVEDARERVRVDVEPLPPVLSIEDSLSCNPVIWGEDNVFKTILITKGDLEGGMAKGHLQMDATYRTGAQEHVYIEPNAIIGEATADGVMVRGSMQCPYYVHHALHELFQLPLEKVRVAQVETGGGFGGKEDYPSMLACHAALLSWKAGGRPVKIAYDREEDMACTTKRHPSRTRIRSAFATDGTLLALDVELILDGGAYVTLSPVVLSRAAIHASGPYRCPNLRVHARALATNAPPHGAFRGFGAPQSLFAIERHMDEAARRLGLDPAELRRKNLLRTGDAMATGQIMRDEVDLVALMDRALTEIRYVEKRDSYPTLNAGDDPVKRGVGFSVFMHGGGFTGSAETTLNSVAALEGTADGQVRVLAASTEMGQGANTVFTQVAAEALQAPADMIVVVPPDTNLVPNSGPTVASRTTQVVGKLVLDAGLAMRKTLLDAGLLKDGNVSEAVRTFVARYGSLRTESRYQKPEFMEWDDMTYRGDAYATYSWACYAVDLRIDLVTYETQVADFVAVQEVGRALNPTLAAGQIEGGVAQGIGWGLNEEVIWRQGSMANHQMSNYLIATAVDLPRIRVFFEERPFAYGPGGAKGLGELPMDGPAPAILNAVQHALQIAPRQVPMTPEVLMDLVEGA
jgi:CO/xanthine dehydrogenase Mo-binding subunit